ncbi:MAG: type II secretion system protein [Patescibacteria group bacterium]|nr:type II secretion system protein [Patescibacteria group bacterium]
MKKGFTLIEIMVATSIFMIVMLVAIGALVSVVNSSKKAEALHYAMDNVNFAMENISRNLRLGSNYYCTSTSGFSLPTTTIGDCPDGNNAIVFTPYNETQSTEAFQLSAFSPKVIQKVTTSGITDLTSSEVEIKELKFFVKGSNLLDGVQPSVYIKMRGVVTVKGEETEFAVQTLASQRNYE